MTYIIDPSWFYWVEVLEGLKNFFAITALILIITLAFTVYIIFDAMSEEADIKRYTKNAKIIALIAGVSILLATFIPSKSTMVQMKVAELATVENVEYGVETVKDLIDYIAATFRGE